MQIKEVPLSEVVKVNATVVEFDEPYNEQYFSERIAGKEHLIIVAYIDQNPAGYIVGYDRFNDGSFYCWMAGVDPRFRRRGVLSALMKYQEEWARGRGYTKIKIKTRNNRREMLAYLIKNNFNIFQVEPSKNIKDYRILLEKESTR